MLRAYVWLSVRDVSDGDGVTWYALNRRHSHVVFVYGWFGITVSYVSVDSHRVRWYNALRSSIRESCDVQEMVTEMVTKKW